MASSCANGAARRFRGLRDRWAIVCAGGHRLSLGWLGVHDGWFVRERPLPARRGAWTS